MGAFSVCSVGSPQLDGDNPGWVHCQQEDWECGDAQSGSAIVERSYALFVFRIGSRLGYRVGRAFPVTEGTVSEG